MNGCDRGFFRLVRQAKNQYRRLEVNRKNIIALVLVCGLPFSKITLADNNKTLGIGIGSLYNGLGVSFGIQDNTSIRYASLGCLSVSQSDSRGTELNCGVGVGILKTGLIGSLGNKHGMGMHIGATYNEHNGLDKVEGFIAPQYVYFFNGIDKHGLNLGASIQFGKRDGESKIGAGVQVGYQF
jgi:hypothetical protein